jgi:hypothetical protein
MQITVDKLKFLEMERELKLAKFVIVVLIVFSVVLFLTCNNCAEALVNCL